jgi:hypothetical protein
MSIILDGKFQDELKLLPKTETYAVVEAFQRHVLETGHRLTYKENPHGPQLYLRCSGCFVTYLFWTNVVEDVWRELLFERVEELVACINRGEDFRVKYFGVRSRFERVV